jgi:proline iminopeptidase
VGRRLVVDGLVVVEGRYRGRDDAGQVEKAARAWAWWTGRVVTYTLGGEFSLDGYDSDKLIKSGAIELHYARNAYFIEENQILANIGRVQNVPVRIIHGRRDVICTVSASWAVDRALQQWELKVHEGDGHLGGEPAMINERVEASDWMADQIGQTV